MKNAFCVKDDIDMFFTIKIQFFSCELQKHEV